MSKFSKRLRKIGFGRTSRRLRQLESQNDQCIHQRLEAVEQQLQFMTSPEFSRGQAAGIVETNSKNKELAECYIGVFVKKSVLSGC